MFTAEQIERFNYYYRIAKLRQERHRLAAAHYRDISTNFKIPLIVGNALSATLVVIQANYSGVILQALTIGTTFWCTITQAMAAISDFDGLSQQYRETSRRYGDIVSFLEREYDVNYGRSSEFYPCVPKNLEDKTKTIAITSADEYARYLFEHVNKMVDEIEDTEEDVPEEAYKVKIEDFEGLIKTKL
jgi:hypothetical protein